MSPSPTGTPRPPSGRTEVERVAREATGRLVALLASRSGDLTLAEDALGGALLAALEHWQEAGVPDEPEAWLYAVARRQLATHWRKDEVRQRKAKELARFQTLLVAPTSGEPWPDERLPLLFVCTHPAIAPDLRAALMLQTVLGLGADDIGPLMGVAAKTMGQRLWRAKTKIRAAGIPFAVPEAPELPQRVGAVLDAIYGLFGVGWGAAGRGSLAHEALWLARVVARLLPEEPEVLGLLALLACSEARRPAGRSGGAFVPLDAQDPASWDATLLAEADDALARASRHRRPGPFQLEAAIQSAVVHGRRRGAVDHDAVAALYDALVRLAPTLGARVGQAAAIAERAGPDAGLAALDAIAEQDGPRAAAFQAWWAVRAALLARRGDGPAARAAYTRTLELTSDPAVVAYLEAQRRGLP